MKELTLSQGRKAIVDDSLYDYLNQWKWTFDSSVGYALRRYNGRKIYLHRIIAGTKKGDYTDHINHNKLDNRKSNLRICTNAENGQNQLKQKRKTSSRFKGVSWSKSMKKWRTQIKGGGVVRVLGHFVNEADAARKYNEAAKRYFGRFANLNVINY